MTPLPQSSRVLVSGASGFVGRALVPHLEKAGHSVFRLVRSAPQGPNEIRWNPPEGVVEFSTDTVFDAVVHLAGENIVAHRWTAARKAAIRESRVASTSGLVRALGQCGHPPRVLVSSSAVGFYGDRGDERLTEQSGPGTGFLADVCEVWEREAEGARAWGARVVLLRTGLVLAADGGALAKMRPIFRAGLGGRLGHGRQWVSWITRDDLIAVIGRALADEKLMGPINAVAPQPMTNAEFTAALARAVHRPAIWPVPAWLLRAIFGEMATATLLASTRATPERLQAVGHVFRHPQLVEALDEILHPKTPSPSHLSPR